MVGCFSLDAGSSVDCIYLDFLKAFDTVSHKRLYNKLKVYGVQNPILKWLANFLSDRLQRVAVNGQYSSW